MQEAGTEQGTREETTEKRKEVDPRISEGPGSVAWWPAGLRERAEPRALGGPHGEAGRAAPAGQPDRMQKAGVPSPKPVQPSTFCESRFLLRNSDGPKATNYLIKRGGNPATQDRLGEGSCSEKEKQLQAINAPDLRAFPSCCVLSESVWTSKSKQFPLTLNP